jgi:double-stranded uracil-DNA glycosylase
MPSPVPPSPADLAAAADRTIPDVLAIAGVTAYRTAFARPRAAIGPQPDPLGTTPVWVLPTPAASTPPGPCPASPKPSASSANPWHDHT